MRPVTRRQADHHAARSAATVAQVLSALQQLLDSGEAFSEISVQRILEEAGVSRATFYAHFQSKADALQRLAGKLRESLLALAQQWDPAAGVDRLAEFFEEVIRIHRAHQSVITAVREAAAYDSTVDDFYTADLEGFDETALRSLLSDQAAGLTPADVDAVSASRIIVWGGAQAIAHHIRVDEGSGDIPFARELAQIWWYGAYRRPSGNQGS
ncbi:TetR/AcrR family transcriptional regulator [Streptomyces sp. NBC_00588]|uniref:TetR/AcrR family transcriptional regulator n=1 Tax=Streptomyces sp. NBC_00588 TaxID=2975784 RepID=UPI002E81A63D|nr:TetR family transcriptional regulator [Streptomyces sp. NBC_00588]WUB40879.1 TetR family transcriptional regulator [Streptomyces sp. NBC_00588]